MRRSLVHRTSSRKSVSREATSFRANACRGTCGRIGFRRARRWTASTCAGHARIREVASLASTGAMPHSLFFAITLSLDSTYRLLLVSVFCATNARPAWSQARTWIARCHSVRSCLYYICAMDSDCGACGTGFGHTLDFSGDPVYGAAHDGCGGPCREISGRWWLISLDAARFRTMVGVSLLLGLLGGHRLSVSKCRTSVCAGGLRDVWAFVCPVGREPLLSARRHVSDDLDRARLESDRDESRQMDRESRRPRDVDCRFVADCGGVARLGAPRLRDAPAHPSQVELGNSQFLGRDRVCDVRYGGTGHDGRRDSRSGANDAARRLDCVWICDLVLRVRDNRFSCCAFTGQDHRSERVRRSGRLSRRTLADAVAFSTPRVAGAREWAWFDRRLGYGDLAAAVCGRRGPVAARCFREDSLEMGDSVHIDSCARNRVELVSDPLPTGR